MDYAITILTLSAPIPVRAGGTVAEKQIPFSNNNTYPAATQPLNLTGATTQTLTVSDDDGKLDGIYGARTYAGKLDTNQTVAKDITFQQGAGSQTLQAGQVFGFDYSGRMFMVENGQIVAVYEIAFPRIPDPEGGKIGEIVGDSYSMMVIPISYTAADGTKYEPMAFDPSKSYYYGGNISYTSTHYAIDYFVADPVVAVCFASGTLIETPEGSRPVELLQAGDLVLTRDQGPQPLVWAGSCPVDAARLDLQPNLRPIRIVAGALGPGQPARDLVLSPQHRVLVRSAIAERMFGTAEILVAVKHLVGLPGITVLARAEGIVYHHLLFARHQLVRAEGAWTESLFLGPQALRGLDPAARREVATLFPELAEAGTLPEPARRLLSGREGRKLAERHERNGKALVSDAETLPTGMPILLPA